MTTKQTIIQNARGIHVRPSGMIAKLLVGYKGTVTVSRPDNPAQAVNEMPLSILALGLGCGEKIVISVDGPDEERLCDELCSLFSTQFDFT